ncbi:thiaminase II [Mesobacillus zeae]|uniref:Aminopyrimidine aminohydrolase n=1 Tax=Mesobacillus zeae TaxID=1917180 RepID=A0A398BE85_9BACI|nr:thiaminase II [Mesobacillus zeae]RID88282.1 thiaminase II [Mesobacillus zeae]
MTFSEEIRKDASAIWEASFTHPFVTGIGDGTLPLENFRYYVLQDAYYLSHFSRIQAIGASQAPDLEGTSRLASHAQSTYQAELSLHENFSKRLGITDAERKSFKPSPTAYAYVSHMYRAALTGQFGDTLAALLPCYWLYYDIGELLKDCNPAEPIYQEMIAAYGSDWFRAIVEEEVARLDQAAEHVTAADRVRMKEHFMISTEYEYMFWEMAYTREEWPLSAQPVR